NVSSAYVRTLQRAASYLASKVPAQLDPDGPLDSERMHLPPDHEAAAFLRHFDATDDPESILKSAERGDISPEEAEALEAIAPDVYRDLQAKTVAPVADRTAAGKPLSFAVQQRLFFTFKTPVHASQRPNVMQILQSNVAGGPEPGQTAGKR